MSTFMCPDAPVIYSLPGNEGLATRLAHAVNAGVGALATHSFPDGETYLRIDSDVAFRDVAVVASLAHPNEKLAPLLFLADALRTEGARRLGIVAPYLPYMRQDAQFHPGEAVTSRSFASLLSRAFDWIITVDPHLHRIHTLRAIYSIPAVSVRASRAMGAWIREHVPNALIVGPDVESRQWVDAVARAASAPSIVMQKTRVDDTHVIESLPELTGYHGLTPVVVDDIISSGHTMAETVKRLRAAGTTQPVCVAVHALLGRSAIECLQEAGVQRVVTTNTIPHCTNDIDLTADLAAALEEQLGAVRVLH